MCCLTSRSTVDGNEVRWRPFFKHVPLFESARVPFQKKPLKARADAEVHELLEGKELMEIGDQAF